MRVTFHSNHATTAGQSGVLLVRIERVGDDGQVVKRGQVQFAVPLGFHAHNDLVATALLTLVGRTYRHVEYNFPISTRCAEGLTAHYRLDEIGSVDAALEPRRPGSFIGLNFSGGVDSTVAWVLLRELLGDDFKVITSQYWSDQHREVTVARRFNPDVICKTNLRERGYDRVGRFNNAVPLLFADYLDLWGVATGHGYTHVPLSYESLRAGQEPYFLRNGLSFSAGGLEEIFLIRGVTEPGVARLLVELAPDLVEGALRASAPPGSDKLLWRVLFFQRAYSEAGLPLPACLREIPEVVSRYNAGRRIPYFRSYWLAQWFGVDVAARATPLIREIDPAAYTTLDYRWTERYHPDMLQLVPHELRSRLTALFHRGGLHPFSERDYIELERMRAYFEAQGLPPIMATE